jgi:fructosamine-3-kinase
MSLSDEQHPQGKSGFIKEHGDLVEDIIGGISEVSRVSGGLVNYVYRVKGHDITVYVKVRKSTFSELPGIQIRPRDIAYESKATEILSREFPDVFPKQLGFFRHESMLVLSDIKHDGNTLEELLNQGSVGADKTKQFGRLLAKIHAHFEGKSTPIREDLDQEYYTKNLEYRFGYHRNPILNNLIFELKKMPRQLILGDLSPKNIIVTNSGKIGICDLEDVHMGNTVFDLSFAAAHIILHNLKDLEKAEKLTVVFFDGYLSLKPSISQEDITLKLATLGIMLYRLDNPVIPYRLNISREAKSIASANIKELLWHTELSWNEVFKCLK